MRGDEREDEEGVVRIGRGLIDRRRSTRGAPGGLLGELSPPGDHEVRRLMLLLLLLLLLLHWTRFHGDGLGGC